jgi:thiamine-phosphate pyrophosphorylase
LACTLWEAARGTAAWVVVNDRLDVARAIGASGVQLPGHGLTVAAARAILDPTIAIGQSVHSAEAARVLFAAGADYVLLGPIWETASHPGTAPLGLDAIRRALPARIVAIGGITDTQRARACCAAGAYGVAVIRAVWHDADPRGAARRILLSLPR